MVSQENRTPYRIPRFSVKPKGLTPVFSDPSHGAFIFRKFPLAAFEFIGMDLSPSSVTVCGTGDVQEFMVHDVVQDKDWNPLTVESRTDHNNVEFLIVISHGATTVTRTPGQHGFPETSSEIGAVYASENLLQVAAFALCADNDLFPGYASKPTHTFLDFRVSAELVVGPAKIAWNGRTVEPGKKCMQNAAKNFFRGIEEQMRDPYRDAGPLFADRALERVVSVKRNAVGTSFRGRVPRTHLAGDAEEPFSRLFNQFGGRPVAGLGFRSWRRFPLGHVLPPHGTVFLPQQILIAVLFNA